jgi:hypothetical protein
MIFLIIFVGIILVYLSFISFYIIDKELYDFGTGLLFGMLIAMLSILEILMICNVLKVPQSQAIDVYRNKTELEITSVNGVPRDNVVVWKGEIKK